MKFRLIEDQREAFPVRVMCDVMGVSPAGYYAWRGRPESPRKAANRALMAEIQWLHATHRGRYGAPRIHAALCARGHAASRGRVARLMRHQGIRAITPRRFRICTTDSHHDLPVAPNRLDQKFCDVLERLARFVGAARGHVVAGDLLPGAGAEEAFNDLAFALPGGAKESYFELKGALIAERLANLAQLWEME